MQVAAHEGSERARFGPAAGEVAEMRRELTGLRVCLQERDAEAAGQAKVSAVALEILRAVCP